MRFDPLVDIAGAFFPGWMLCIILGIALTAIFRWVFARTGLEPSLGPLIFIYPTLATGISFALWLVLYRRAR